MEDISFGEEKFPISFLNSYDSDSLPSFQYTPVNIPGPRTDANDFQTTYCGCTCKEKCSSDCPCIQQFGCNYDDKGHLLTDTFGDYDKLIIECNLLCSCTEKCSNRVVQQGLQLFLQVFKTPNKGFGVKTLALIKKSQFVCEYAGEVLTKNEALQRYSLINQNDNNYIIVVNEHIGNERKIETIIDPTYYGNVARFINHSCSPNLFMIPVRTDCIVPKLCLFASRDILPFEELCYDYSGGIFSKQLNKCINTLQTSKIDKPLKQCFCDSPLCKGLLPHDVFLLALT